MGVCRWGWHGTWTEFVQTPPHVICDRLRAHHDERFGDLTASQVVAWEQSVPICQETIRRVLAKDSALGESLVVLEYEIPGGPGNRSDAILVTASGHVLVLEFKGYGVLMKEDLDQAAGYAGDLKDYHSKCRDLQVDSMLVLLGADREIDPPETHPGLLIAGKRDQWIPAVLAWVEGRSDSEVRKLEPLTWLDGVFEPAPYILDAAVRTFSNEKLPRIKAVENTEIPRILDWLRRVVEQAKARKRHYLVLMTGVPGSGKTMVGLTLVANENRRGNKALYLSGNGPLVAVLQDYLRRHGIQSESFIRPMTAFRWNTAGHDRPLGFNVLVFDEGQRAHEKVKGYRGSEIELVIDVASREEWGVVVALIGNGQEIYRNESGTPEKWIADFEKANKRSARWVVYVPEANLADRPRGIVHRPEAHLTTCLRSKRVENLHEWVEALLSGAPVERMRELTRALQEQHYPIYVTQSREEAEAYVRSRYKHQTEKLYGWVASSYCTRNGYGLKQLPPVSRETLPQYVAWFNDGACRELKMACSQFGCQGLELDFALVYWGRDLVWDENVGWKLGPALKGNVERPEVRVPNTYRVLMTRGREGMIILCEERNTLMRLQQ